MADELDPWQELGNELYADEHPPERSAIRICSAGACLILGVFVGALALIGILETMDPREDRWILKWLARAAIFVVTGIWGVGFAIYDYRWPFGPRPSARQ